MVHLQICHKDRYEFIDFPLTDQSLRSGLSHQIKTQTSLVEPNHSIIAIFYNNALIEYLDDPIEMYKFNEEDKVRIITEIRNNTPEQLQMMKNATGSNRR